MILLFPSLYFTVVIFIRGRFAAEALHWSPLNRTLGSDKPKIENFEIPLSLRVFIF